MKDTNTPISERQCVINGCDRQALFSGSKFSKPTICYIHKSPHNKSFAHRVCDYCQTRYILGNDSFVYIDIINSRGYMLCSKHANIPNVYKVHVNRLNEMDPDYLNLGPETMKLTDEILEFAKSCGYEC